MYKDLNTSFDMGKILTYIKHFVILTSLVEHVTQVAMYILSHKIEKARIYWKVHSAIEHFDWHFYLK